MSQPEGLGAVCSQDNLYQHCDCRHHLVPPLHHPDGVSGMYLEQWPATILRTMCLCAFPHAARHLPTATGM